MPIWRIQQISVYDMTYRNHQAWVVCLSAVLDFQASASIWATSLLKELQIQGELMRNHATSKRQARAEVAASTLAPTPII